MMNLLAKAVLFCVAILSVPCMFAGCSGDSEELGAVRGKVLREGNPLAGATVVFENADKGVSVRTKTGTDGGYEVRTAKGRGLPPGEYQVAIHPEVEPGPDRAMVKPGNAEDLPKSGGIPAKYRKFSTSGLTISVSLGDSQAFDFDLK